MKKQNLLIIGLFFTEYKIFYKLWLITLSAAPWAGLIWPGRRAQASSKLLNQRSSHHTARLAGQK
jgi:hypothetical protein